MFDVIIFTDSPSHGRTRGHGAHAISAHIREHGYSCLVVDHIATLTYELYTKILDLAVGENTLVVGYSTTWFSTQFHPLKKQDTLSNAFDDNRLSKWLEYPKTLNSNVKTVIGGGRNHNQIIGEVDHIILGLGETMFMDLLNSLSANGTTYDRIMDYDTEAKNPYWDFRKSTTNYTDLDLIQPTDPLTIETGRGCRFRCKFCTYPLIGKKNITDYLRYPEYIKKELLENYERWGTTQYYIVDDTFNDSVEKIQMMLDITRSLPFKPEYWAFTRLDLMISYPETIPMLKEMGLKQTYIGIETFDEMAGKVIGKGLSREKKVWGLEQLKNIWGDQVNIQSGLIVGLPHETQDSINKTVDYLSNPDCPVHFATMIPLFLSGPTPERNELMTSIFDREYDKYGYSFPDLTNHRLYWEKNDGSDIFNYAQAVEIAKNANDQLPKTFHRGFVYGEIFEYPKYKELSKVTLTQREFDEARFDSTMNIANQHRVIEVYFKPLIHKLEEARQFNWRTPPEEFQKFKSLMTL